MDSDLKQYLDEKGWAWKLVEGQRQVRVDDECPFCGKTKHLMFESATTKWDCKRCGESGNLLTMKRRLGDLKIEVRSAADFVFYRGKRDATAPLPGERPPAGIDLKFHERLMGEEVPEVLEYLLDVRGFTEETLRRFKIGVAGKAGSVLIAIPHYYRDELVCFKFRTIPPVDKSFSRWKDCPSILFNGDCLVGLDELPANERRVAVCEGEFDAMALVQLGWEKVVSSTSGAGRADWPAHWLEPLEPATTLFLCFDADAAGEDGAEKAAAVLGRHRCRRVAPPLHDVAECVAAGMDRQVMVDSFARSTEYGECVVKPTSAYCDDLRALLSRGQPRGRSTGWLTLDAIIGGIRDGELTVVTGDTGSGKSTWTTALARAQVQQGVPTLIAPFEQQPPDVVGKLCSMESGQSVYDLPKIELEAALSRVVDFPIYFIDRHGPTPLGEVKDAIYVAAQRYGVRFVVLDHLHFFLDCKPEEERTCIDATMRALAVWVQDLQIHIALVVHPAKLGKDQHGVVRKVTLDDLKGSSEIKKTAWNGIRVWRDRKDAMGSRADDTEIAVLKCRSPAGAEGATTLHFNPAGELYIEGTYSAAGAAPPPSFDPETQTWHDWNEPQ